MENHAYSTNTDEQLFEICKTDRDAFGELARRYRPFAFRAAFSLLRNVFDAEEQVQSALCKAFEHFHEFECRSKFSTWLVRIVVNECLMHLRQSRRVHTISLDAPGAESLLTKIQEDHAPTSPVDEHWRARLLEREIRRIPPLLRNAFLLRDVEELPMAEVATNLGISVQAAKSRLSRARRELRRRLEPYILEHYLTRPAERRLSPIRN